jgi:hypothetical protein
MSYAPALASFTRFRVTRRILARLSKLMATPKGKNYLILLLALATMAGGALAWHQYQELIKLRASGLTDSARTDLQKRLWDLEKRKNELEAEIAGLRARGNAAADAADEGDAGSTVAENLPGPARGPGRFDRRNGPANLTTLLENPEFNKLWTDQQKARINSTYGALFKSLNLTPEQTAQFQNLLAERQMSMLDVLSAAHAEGVTGRDQITSLVQQAGSAIDSQIQSLLGPDGYSQYNNYLQTMPQRNQVNQLQTLLVTSGGTPLQDYQTQQLAQILAQNSAGSNGGQRGGGGFLGAMGGMGGLFATPVSGPTITSGAVTQAASVLTPAQLQVLQQMQQQQAAQQQINRMLRQSFNGAQGGGTPGTATKTTGGSGQPSTPPKG